MKAPLPLWRSILYVPANVDRFVERAHQRGADAILLDLEDSVAPADKETAREKLPAAIDRLARAGVDVGVRINRPLGLAVRDCEAAVRPGVSFLCLPKVEGADHVRLFAELVSDLERRCAMAEGSIRFIVLVESAVAFLKLEAIARSDPRIVALVLGSEDFAASCGMEPSYEALLAPKQMAVVAARAASLLPLGIVGSPADIADIEAFRMAARRACTLGFGGSFAIHPNQVRVLNKEFSPSADAVEEARALVVAAGETGAGSFLFKGRMVDRPVLERAADLIARAERIEARARACTSA